MTGCKVVSEASLSFSLSLAVGATVLAKPVPVWTGTGKTWSRGLRLGRPFWLVRLIALVPRVQGVKCGV